MGKPSAILGRAAVVRKRARAARAIRSCLTVVLLCERVRTVLHCLRQKDFLQLVSFRCHFGIRKKMRLKSALEDFEANTLGVVPGLLGRLSYVGSLRDEEGQYGHWGLAKVYGDDAAQSAIRASHRVLLSEILKKPLAVLLQDVPVSCAKQHLTEKELLATLEQSPPKPLSPAARSHLRSVLSALSALVESRDSANLRDASQSQ